MSPAKAWEDLRALESSPEYIDLRAREFPYRDIALAVVELRGRLGITQTQLANAVGTQQSVISRLESGRHPVEVKLLTRIAEAFGVPLAVAFGIAPASEPLEHREQPAASGDPLLDAFNAANTSRDFRAAHAAALKIAKEPTTARRQVALALHSYNQGDYAEAERWAREAVAGDLPPASGDVASLVLARSLVNLDRAGEALQILDAVGDGSSLGWVVAAARADAYVELHDADRALAESERALAAAGDEPEARYLAARTAWHADRIWDALEQVSVFRAVAPGSLDGMLLHGSILGFLASRSDDTDAYRSALAVFEEALPTGDCEAQRLYATTAARLGEWKRAFDTAAKFLKNRGEDGSGHCQHTEKGGDHRHYVYEHILPDAFSALGEEDPQAIEKAAAFAEKRFGPQEFLVTQRALARALQGDLAGTFKVVGRTRATLADASPDVQIAVAAAYYTRNEFGAAFDILRRVKDSLTSPDLLLRLAECAAAAGELGAARETLEELAKRDDPPGQVARVALSVSRAERAAAKAAAGRPEIDLRWFGPTTADDSTPRHSLWEGRHQRTTRMVDELPRRSLLN